MSAVTPPPLLVKAVPVAVSVPSTVIPSACCCRCPGPPSGGSDVHRRSGVDPDRHPVVDLRARVAGHRQRGPRLDLEGGYDDVESWGEGEVGRLGQSIVPLARWPS